jgi:UDP-2-acetamido-2,6-beta-L-arabino-hexul-4-ose reductase
MIEGVRVDPLEIKRDDRGWLAELLRSSRLGGGARIAQLYVTVGNPGKTKGRHYHTRKTEWFSVVSGDAKLFLHDTRTGEETTVKIGEQNMVTVTIPPHVAHAISSDGDRPFYLIVIVSEEFNPQDPDTFPFDFPGI